MSKIRITGVDELDKWDKFVFSHKDGSIYHTSLWRKIIETVYKHRPLYPVIEDDGGDIIAGLASFLITSRITGNRLSSMPCAQTCNPLASNQDDYDRLINFTLELMKKRNVKYLELKTSADFHLDSRKFGKALNCYSTYVLDLDQPLEAIQKSFHKNCVQRAIKKAYKSDLKLVVGESLQNVKDFYRQYLKMRTGHGLMPQPYSFFRAMWEIMSPEDHIDILNAEHAGSIVASILLLKYKDTVIYEYGASTPEMLNLRPNHFLLWESIKRSRLNGYKKFDFGRTANDNKNLIDFKRRWGAKDEALSYYYIPDMNGFAITRERSLMKNIMRHSITHMPDSLCQIMGRLLYRITL